MRKFLAALLIALSLASLPACSGLSGVFGGPLAPSTEGGQSSTSLGPDGVETAQETSTLPARVESGIEWLWASYSALKAKGVDVASLRQALVDLEAVVSKGDLVAALDLYAKARALVTEVAR